MITDYSKQETLFRPSNYSGRINIIGCGACGSWLAFFLLKMGFKNIHVYDYDVVEEHNIPNQLFKESHIGSLKVRALKNIYNEFFFDDDERLVVHPDPITSTNANRLKGVIFNAVDSMAARQYIYERAYKYGQAELLIEDRLSVYGGYIYTLGKDLERHENEYEKTFYEDEDAEVSACGISQTALPAAVTTASIMIMQLISWIKKENVHFKVLYTIPDMYSIIS